ncbi:MAG: DUF3189 family protein [Syntrophomonadaceae bacterium]|nr:DUF3189 family protein [Syntrophomonadaceae bacterium]
MKIVFLANTGVHHALIAANIFLEKLEKDDFRLVKGFCDISKDVSGFPIFVGEDKAGNQVYTVGVGDDLNIARKTIEELAQMFGYSSRDLVVKPVSIKGERLISLLSKIPHLLGGSYLNLHISSYIIKLNFARLFEEISVFKAQLNIAP